ncbi:type II secretion system protein GspM [Xanthobacter oligotrophicus]|uniref:Type II secretion system protein GspM n=1 Tax=Xanthobacter oligotrophicus TaxID=2607286 RepID=A0ABW7A5L8_9HYPH
MALPFLHVTPKPTPQLAISEPPGKALISAAIYGTVVLTLFTVAIGTVSDLVARRAAIAEELEMLDRYSGRRSRSTPGAASSEIGSRFLEGPTATIAGAALVERLSSAVETSGGRMSSSRLDVDSSAWGSGFLSAEANLEIQESDLQKLLHDIEAGLPFLYVGQLTVQGGAIAPSSEDRRLKVTFTVYGRWQGAP